MSYSLKPVLITIIFVIVLFFLMAGCSQVVEPSPGETGKEVMTQEEESLENETMETEEKTVDTGAISAESVTIDGEIDDAEYMSSIQDSTTGIELFWSHNNQDLYIGIITGSPGWVSIGFDPQSAMKGANIIFLALDGDTVIVRDDFGTSSFGHDEDVKLGGSPDIVEFAGKKSGNGAVYEFIMPMDSGDEFDSSLSPGNSYKIILAVNNSNIDFDRKHTARSSSEIELD